MTLPLDEPLTALTGVGAARAATLRAFRLASAGDLNEYLPCRDQSEAEEMSIDHPLANANPIFRAANTADHGVRSEACDRDQFNVAIRDRIPSNSAAMERSEEKSCCVVLTACIAPTATHLLSRTDPKVRLDDYLQTLRFWLDLPDPRVRSILMTENSGASLDSLRALAASHNPHGRRVAIEHLGDNVIPEGISYGYPELTMLAAAAAASPLWRDHTTRWIVKATGRLRFPAISRLLDRTPASVEFMADARDRRRPGRRTANGGVLSTQLLLFTPAFYDRHLAGIREMLRPEYGWRYIENVLFRALYPLHDDGVVRFRFPVNCVPSGQAGAWTKSYDSPRQRVEDAVRAVARVVTPSWWI